MRIKSDLTKSIYNWIMLDVHYRVHKDVHNVDVVRNWIPFISSQFLANERNQIMEETKPKIIETCIPTLPFDPLDRNFQPIQ